MSLQWIFFDSGGTLWGGGADDGSDPSSADVRAGRFGRVAALLPEFEVYVERDKLEEVVLECEEACPAEHGHSYSFHVLMTEFLVRLGLDLGTDVAAVLASAYAGPRYVSWIYPGTGEMLESLAGAGVKLGIIANTAWPGFTMDRAFAGAGLLGHFRVRIYSCDVGLSKPDERIFRLAEELSGAYGDELLYVGDSVANDIEGASRVGWRTALRRSSCPSSDGLADFEFDDSLQLAEFAKGLM